MNEVREEMHVNGYWWSSERKGSEIGYEIKNEGFSQMFNLVIKWSENSDRAQFPRYSKLIFYLQSNESEKEISRFNSRLMNNQY